MTEPVCKIDNFGTKRWYLNGKPHRIDGPAIEWANGSKSWWKHGRLHREDGPAVERINGIKKWWINGRLHREDGPAIEWSAVNQYDWYLNNHFMAEGWKPKNWDELVLLAQIERVMND